MQAFEFEAKIEGHQMLTQPIGGKSGEGHAVRDRIVRGRPLWRTLAELAHAHGQGFVDPGIRRILVPKVVRREVGGIFALDRAMAAE